MEILRGVRILITATAGVAVVTGLITLAFAAGIFVGFSSQNPDVVREIATALTDTATEQIQLGAEWMKANLGSMLTKTSDGKDEFLNGDATSIAHHPPIMRDAEGLWVVGDGVKVVTTNCIYCPEPIRKIRCRVGNNINRCLYDSNGSIPPKRLHAVCPTVYDCVVTVDLGRWWRDAVVLTAIGVLGCVVIAILLFAVVYVVVPFAKVILYGLFVLATAPRAFRKFFDAAANKQVHSVLWNNPVCGVQIREDGTLEVLGEGNRVVQTFRTDSRRKKNVTKSHFPNSTITADVSDFVSVWNARDKPEYQDAWIPIVYHGVVLFAIVFPRKNENNVDVIAHLRQSETHPVRITLFEPEATSDEETHAPKVAIEPAPTPSTVAQELAAPVESVGTKVEVEKVKDVPAPETPTPAPQPVAELEPAPVQPSAAEPTNSPAVVERPVAPVRLDSVLDNVLFTFFEPAWVGNHGLIALREENLTFEITPSNVLWIRGAGEKETHIQTQTIKVHHSRGYVHSTAQPISPHDLVEIVNGNTRKKFDLDCWHSVVVGPQSKPLFELILYKDVQYAKIDDKLYIGLGMLRPIQNSPIRIVLLRTRVGRIIPA